MYGTVIIYLGLNKHLWLLDQFENDPLYNKIDCHQFYLYIYIYIYIYDDVQEGLCVLGGCCLICQDLVSCYFYFVLLPLGPEVW